MYSGVGKYSNITVMVEIILLTTVATLLSKGMTICLQSPATLRRPFLRALVPHTPAYILLRYQKRRMSVRLNSYCCFQHL